MLDTPDVRQKDDYRCGPVCMDCAFRLLGARITASALDIASPIDGTHPAAIEHGFRAAGLNVCSGSMTVDDLKHHTRLGRPVLCSTAIFGGHWVVVRGVQRKRVYYHCPVEGRKSLPVDTWVGLWHDFERTGHAFVQWGIATWSHKS